MLKTLYRLVPASGVLWQNLQSMKNAPSVNFRRSLVTSKTCHCVKVATTEDSSSDGDMESTSNKKSTNNPFVQQNSTSNKKSTNNPFVQQKATETLNEIILDPERKKLLKVLQLEVDIAGQEGRRVPALESITDEQWVHILGLPSKSARFRFYSFLWQVEVRKLAQERKKEERAIKTAERKEELRKEREENTHIIYGLGHTSQFLRIYDSTINHFQNHRLIRAMQFSPKIVLDCSYDEHMNRREAMNTGKQLMLCFAENRAHDDPFDMHYCNVDLNSVASQALRRYIPTMLNPEFPMNVHEKCFTELFDKKNLVYLTPHCRTDLECYNPEDIYIIGAIVDTTNHEPLSLAKAKRMGLRMARLPLDRYLQWGAGSGKSLTLNHMVNVLLDLKSTKDWTQALRHVPRRKITDMSEEARLRIRHKLEKRADKLNFNVKDLLDGKEGNEKREYRRSYTALRKPTKNVEFNLETWGSSKKKNRNSN